MVTCRTLRLFAGLSKSQTMMSRALWKRMVSNTTVATRSSRTSRRSAGSSTYLTIYSERYPAQFAPFLRLVSAPSPLLPPFVRTTRRASLDCWHDCVLGVRMIVVTEATAKDDDTMPVICYGRDAQLSIIARNAFLLDAIEPRAAYATWNAISMTCARVNDGNNTLLSLPSTCLLCRLVRPTTLTRTSALCAAPTIAFLSRNALVSIARLTFRFVNELVRNVPSTFSRRKRRNESKTKLQARSRRVATARKVSKRPRRHSAQERGSGRRAR